MPQVAVSFNDFVQDTLLVVSERWPVLADGTARIDVRQLALVCKLRR